MRRTENHLLHPAWTLALPLIAATAVVACPAERRLFVTIAAAAVYALMQWMVPKCRFRTDHYFSPVNVALGLLLIKLVVAPMLVMAVDPKNELFIGMPTRASMEGSIAIDVIAYIGLCLGLGFAGEGRAPLALRVFSTAPGRTTAVIFAALGMVGFYLAFGSPGRLTRMLLDPSTMVNTKLGADGGITAFLDTVLRPFFAFALVAWWSRSADREGSATFRAVVAAIGITVANMTFSFNRAAFVFPLVSLIAAYSVRVRRISPVATAAALAVMFPLLFMLGGYRAKVLAPPTALAGVGAIEASLYEISDTVQAYAGGPALTGLFLQQQEWGAHPYGGSTLVASALSPVPIVGKSFREGSGSALYNRVLYGMPGYEDQIIPFSAELFVNFHAAGVLAGFFLLGRLLARAHVWFSAAESSFGAFAIQYMFMWCAMLSVWSLSVVSQIAIYFLGPVYLYAAAVEVRRWLRGMRVPRLASSY
ncbi:MAG: hypothetical protein LAO79_27210 [Acidobacteriia bacterium]|nr:hypothetical protein [Terriglobia bacterium]